MHIAITNEQTLYQDPDIMKSITSHCLALSLAAMASAFTPARMNTNPVSSFPLQALSSPNLVSILKKPSKVLTVNVEVGDSIPKDDLELLSMQLRNSKVTSLWTQSKSPIASLVKEQETARGNFPGPCPVVYFGEISSNIDEVLDAGVRTIVVPAEAAERMLEDPDRLGSTEVVWKVSSVEEATSIMSATNQQADAFWIDSHDQFEEIASCLPEDSLLVYAVDAMQSDEGEITQAKSKKLASSILVRDACVGDQEDLPYAQYLVSKCTSKASSEFSFSGLTGSTNGHFGGVQSNGSFQWSRCGVKA